MMRTITVLLVAALAMAAHAGARQPQAPDPRTGLIVGQVVDATSAKPIAGAVVSISGPASVPTAPGQRTAAPPRILTGSDGYFLFRNLPRGSFTINASKPGYAAGATGRRRPSGPTQSLTLREGDRRANVIVRMWKYGAISGTVVDEAGEPVAVVQVWAFRRGVLAGLRRFVDASIAVTDDRGVYRFGSLTPGDYVVATSARPITTQLFPGTSSEEVAPLPGTMFAIQVGQVAYSLGRGAPVPPPAAGDAMFVYPPTFAPSGALNQATVVPLGSGEERTAVDINLRPVRGVRVSGVVMGPGGPHDASLALELTPAESEELEQDAPATISDRTGAFTFAGVPSGQYTLRVARRPRQPGTQTQTAPVLWADVPVAVGRTDIDGLIVTLQQGLRVSGRFEFDGVTPKPSAQRLAQVPVVVEPADRPVSIQGPTPPSRVDGSGQFTTADFPAGKYFVRIGGSPEGWMFKSAMFNGRDIADTPFDLQGADATGVVITFTDRWSGLRGIVQSSKGVDADATVLVFPTDPQMWTGSGLNPRRIRSARASATGEYNFASLLPGDYYVVAIPDDQAADWQDAKFMESLARLATRVTIDEGEKKTQDLHRREVR